VPDDDDDDDDDDGGVRVSGRVEGLSGSCPALRFTVRGSVVVTSAQTDFRRGRCRDVRNGLDVTVDGTRRSDDSIEARRVELGRE
jgi:hypothetical protein